MPPPAIPVKHGALLQIGMQFQFDDGTPIDISGAMIACHFRDALSNPMGTATIALAVATGAAILTASPLVTAAMTPGEVFGDIFLQLPGGVFISETFSLAVSPNITPGAT